VAEEVHERRLAHRIRGGVAHLRQDCPNLLELMSRGRVHEALECGGLLGRRSPAKRSEVSR
jgi:hypothetical protein